MLSIVESIADKKKYNTLLTNYVNELRERSDKTKLNDFAILRGFPLKDIEECGIFYIGEMAEMLIPDYLDVVKDLGIISPTNNKPIYSHRWVIPIYNTEGLVEGLVGYSPTADERYIYSTSKYYRRTQTMWGLERLERAYELGYAIVTEGITDAIRLRSMGYEPVFSTCGTHKADFIMKQLNRCRHGIIRIPDRDKAGLNALKGWETNRHVTLYVALKYKDTDEMCKESDENKEWLKDYLNACINWIVSDEHRGRKCLCEKVTVL